MRPLREQQLTARRQHRRAFTDIVHAGDALHKIGRRKIPRCRAQFIGGIKVHGPAVGMAERRQARLILFQIDAGGLHNALQGQTMFRTERRKHCFQLFR